MFKKLNILLPLVLGTLCSLTALGKGSQFDSVTPTFYLNTLFGFSTYKSELVASNDTSTGYMYELGGYAGRDGSIGFALRVDSTATAFALNESSNAITWQDTILKYRYSFFYIGALFTTLNYTVNNVGTDIIEASGSGIGGNLGMLIPISKGSLVVDIVSVTPSTVINKLESDVTIASRLDANIGGSFRVTNAIDFLFGYRQQSYSVTTDTSYNESYLLTYLGFKFSISF